jgi:hypothetical protein
MEYTSKRAVTLAALVAVAVQVNCGAGSDSVASHDSGGAASGGLSEDASSDYETFDVLWREGAIVQDDLQAVQAALVSADYAKGMLVFDPRLAGLDALEVGDVALFGGIGIFRIVGRESSDLGVRLSVEEAPLTDVIEQGTIAFRQSFLSGPDDEKVGLGSGQDETNAIRQLREPLLDPGGLRYSGTVSGLQLDFSLIPSASRTLDMKLDGHYGAGAAKIDLKLTGTLRGVTTDAFIQIDKHSLTAYRVETSEIDGDLSIEADATALGQIEQTISVPARIALPVVLGGIPFHVDLGGAVEVVSTLTTQATAKFKGKAQFKGAVGINFSAGQLTLNDSMLEGETTFDAGTLSSDVTAGLRITGIFPEVGIGVGLAQLASGNAFVRFKTEALANLEIEQRTAVLLPVPVIDTETKHCLEASISVGATYGGNAKFVGITVAEGELPLATLFGEKNRNGDGCE